MSGEGDAQFGMREDSEGPEDGPCVKSKAQEEEDDCKGKREITGSGLGYNLSSGPFMVLSFFFMLIPLVWPSTRDWRNINVMTFNVRPQLCWWNVADNAKSSCVTT